MKTRSGHSMTLTIQEAIDDLQEIADKHPDADLAIMYKDQESQAIKYDETLNIATIVR